jgi:uncharacterized membrane-anchored protein
MSFTSHSQRDFVWHELHARPYVRFSGPAHVFHFAFLSGDTTRVSDHVGFGRLKESFGLQATYESERHAIYTAPVAGLGRLVVAIERHADFVTCTFFVYDLTIPFEPFGLKVLDLLPIEFLESFGTPPLVATSLTIGSANEIPAVADDLKGLFEGHTINGSRVMAGQAEAFSCYRVHKDGFNRIALAVEQMSPRDLGRTVQRLLVIEDSYHLSLLSLPLAREIKSELADWEERVLVEMDALRVADTLEKKRAVLDSFLEVSAGVEHLRTRAANPFAASSAYFAILENQLKELRERKIKHVLRLSSFLMRRLAPADQTHRSVQERLTNLSERITRAADLLNTGIDLDVEEQNRQLLESVNRRTHLQLELQHAVEGLSVVILTYYTLGVLSHVLDAAINLGMNFRPELVLGITAPILLLLYWALILRIRKSIGKH